MNTKFEVGYIPDDNSDTIRVRSISLSPRDIFTPFKGKSAAIYLSNEVLYYTSSTRRFAVEILRVNEVYRSGSFHSRKRFVTKLLKKWSLSSKEVEVPIKVVETPKVKAKPKLKHSPQGIQVDVVRVPLLNSYLVTRVQALPQKKLPLIYTDEEPEYTLPRVWQDGDRLMANNHHPLLRTGNTYSYGQLKKALLYIELAGKHLTVANQHIKPLQAKWAKSNVITFKDGRLLKDTTFQNHDEVDLGTVDISEGFKNNFWASLIC